MFKRVVLAVDGSEQSLKAAEKAIFIAEKSTAHVDVLYVAERTVSKADVIKAWDSLGITESRKHKMSVVEKKAKEQGISYGIKIIRGEPASAIVQYAEGVKADLIVIGSRGLNQFQQFILGSVSHKVMKKAKCPVLLVKSR